MKKRSGSKEGGAGGEWRKRREEGEVERRRSGKVKQKGTGGGQGSMRRREGEEETKKKGRGGERI